MVYYMQWTEEEAQDWLGFALKEVSVISLVWMNGKLLYRIYGRVIYALITNLETLKAVQNIKIQLQKTGQNIQI